MPDGDHHHAAMSWIGAERAKLEESRARIERQRAALIAVEVALMRYAELAGLDHPLPLPLSGGAPEDALPPHASGEPPGDAPAPALDAPDLGNGMGAPAGGKRRLPGGQDADGGAWGLAGRARTVGADSVLPAPGKRACERCGATFEPRQSGGVTQRYCGLRCRRLAHKERRPRKADLDDDDDDPEPLDALLRPPMPVVEKAEVAPPAAPPVRPGLERGYVGSMIANAPPIFDDAMMRAARIHDQAGDERFIAALAPALSPEARQRAESVRVLAHRRRPEPQTPGSARHEAAATAHESVANAQKPNSIFSIDHQPPQPINFGGQTPCRPSRAGPRSRVRSEFLNSLSQ